MITIESGKTVVYKTSPKVRVVEEKPTQLDIANASCTGLLVNGFGKFEAREACKVLYEKYPAIYVETMFKSDVKRRAKLEAINTLLNED